MKHQAYQVSLTIVVTQTVRLPVDAEVEEVERRALRRITKGLEAQGLKVEEVIGGSRVAL